jgi:hypothetical protein
MINRLTGEPISPARTTEVPVFVQSCCMLLKIDAIRPSTMSSEQWSVYKKSHVKR